MILINELTRKKTINFNVLYLLCVFGVGREGYWPEGFDEGSFSSGLLTWGYFSQGVNGNHAYRHIMVKLRYPSNN